jgi:hypothetical protein
MKRGLRWLGIGLVGLVGLIVAVAVILYLVGSSKLSRTYEVQTASLTIPSDSAAIARPPHGSLSQNWQCVCSSRVV